MKTNVYELARQRGDKIEQARGILNRAEKENREPTNAERGQFNKLIDEADSLRLQIADAQSGESLGRVTQMQTHDPMAEVEGRLIPKNQSLASRYRNSATSERCNLAKMIARAAGFDVQDSAAEAKMLSTSMDTGGGFAVPVQTAAEIVDLARSKSVVFQAGARILEMKSGKEVLPKLIEDFQGTWKPEGAVCLPTEGVLGATNLNARTLMCWLPVSNELLQDAQNMDTFLRDALGDMMAVTMDKAFLVGSGAGEIPLGLFNSPDVTTTPPIGGSYSYDDRINSVGRIEAANYSPTATVCSIETQTFYRKLKDGEGRYIQPLDYLPPVLATSSVTNSFGSGTQAMMCTGDFSQLVVGLRLGLRIEILKEAAAQRNQTVICAILRADMGLLRPKAFDIVGPATV